MSDVSRGFGPALQARGSDWELNNLTREQLLARRVVRLRAEGLSLRQIGRELSRLGFRTPWFGETWDATQVRRVLRAAIADAPARLAAIEAEAADLRKILGRDALS
jgi:hypothetical protein